ncbi:MAG: ISNCY family transposase [Rhodanobacter sp.]|nr:ISNCY family transposase [Rhodanobacter sp.]
MRPKQDSQSRLEIPFSNLKVTNEYFAIYQEISRVLDRNPEILGLVHANLQQGLDNINRGCRKGARAGFHYTSENVLRIILSRKIEGASYRGIVVRIDDSKFLRQFTRIYEGPMMDFTTLNKLECAISPQTWEKINALLMKWAVEQEMTDGNSLRLDTTAVETNIHYPTDSWLLWDLYRVLARCIEQARELDRDLVGTRRLQTKKVKKLQHKIARAAGKRKPVDVVKPLYEKLLALVDAICDWSREVAAALALSLEQQRHGFWEAMAAETVLEDLSRFLTLAPRVIDQAHRRVVLGEKVPNDDKLFSIFEEHTELLVRGKAGKNVEFGHMVLIGQVDNKLISHYEIFDKKPVEHKLLTPALKAHEKTFGALPSRLAADKGFYENMNGVRDLEKKIPTVAIAKKGNRTEQETEREHSPEFRAGQRFRAGVEGTISFLKRALGMARILRKGWEHFLAEIGAAVFAHNLLILARL